MSTFAKKAAKYAGWSRLFSPKCSKPNTEALLEMYPLFDDITAGELALNAIGSTHIIAAKAFRNKGSGRNNIAAISERIERVETVNGEITDRVNERKVYILEQVGKVFRPVWESQDLHTPNNLRVIDMDNDGICEISFTDEANGMIGGSKELNIYFLATQKLYKVEEFYHWGSLGGPAYSFEITPEVSGSLQSKLEQFALSQGFLTGEIPDFKDSIPLV